MRTLGFVLVAACLLATAPAVEAGPPSGADCDVKEEYVTGASVGTDPSDPGGVLTPGAHRPIECYY